MHAVASKIQEQIQSGTVPPSLACWLQDVTIREEDHGNIAFLCPNEFSRNRIRNKFQAPLSLLVREACGKEVSLSFETIREKRSDKEVKASLMHSLIPEESKSTEIDPLQNVPDQTPKKKTPVQLELFPGYNSRFRFSEFIVGDSNRFAWSAAREVSEQFSDSYNPLVISAPTGLGKHTLGRPLVLRSAKTIEAAGYAIRRQKASLQK